ncbi:uncharacterized protein F4812DRAFT_281567 [Daldinia caldariorum]|uniref:uncharacterized protein n=1 Tax=Daldinia caldariorum TaxID=326644 RepID=UPI0020084B1E|nr:uncharacterized protein F4812DRAFT_281567 [Daldinia caldariorum]KAI1470863.1 hypothetical protein F4812DRAFT_281567 [Daldinia caldariorum]
MASNEKPQPKVQTGDEDEVSALSSPVLSTNENNPAPVTRDEPQESANEETPSLPSRPVGNTTAQQGPPVPPQPLPQPYPQYPSPYGPYSYPPQPYPYAQPVRVLPCYSKLWTAAKLVLTIFSIIFATVILALSCVFLGDDGGAESMAIYAFPITIAAILWNGAELITFAIRSRKDVKRGIHPGAHVGLHLCFWLACIFAVLLTVSILASVESILRRCAGEDSTHYSYSSYSYCSSDYLDMYGNGAYLPMIRAANAFFGLATIDHFILFVMACIDTHKRNLLKPAGIVLPPMPPAGGMYYPPPPPPPGAAYYPYPVPMQMLPQPPQLSQARPGQLNPVPNGAGAAVPTVPQANPVNQNYQNIAGFYAPAPPQPSYLLAQPPANSNNEKAAPITSAVPAQAS